MDQSTVPLLCILKSTKFKIKMDKLIELSFVGPLHNSTLEDVTKLGDFPKYTSKEVYNLSKGRIESYYAEHSLGDPKVLPVSDVDSLVKQVIDAGDDTAGFLRTLKTQGKINQAQLDLLLSMNDAFKNALDPNVICNKLFKLSQDVEKASGLSFSEKTLVWGAANVGMSSAPYWYSGFNNPDSPWGGGGNPPGMKWWVRGLRDLLGFVVGAAAGGLISGGNPVVMGAGGTLVGTACSAG